MTEINLDLNRDRIRDILREVYHGCQDQLGVVFDIEEEKFVGRINPYLDSNRVSIPVFIPLPSKKYPDLKIEVDLRRCKVFARMISKNKQAFLNYYLKSL